MSVWTLTNLTKIPLSSVALEMRKEREDVVKESLFIVLLITVSCCQGDSHVFLAGGS